MGESIYHYRRVTESFIQVELLLLTQDEHRHLPHCNHDDLNFLRNDVTSVAH